MGETTSSRAGEVPSQLSGEIDRAGEVPASVGEVTRAGEVPTFSGEAV